MTYVDLMKFFFLNGFSLIKILYIELKDNFYHKLFLEIELWEFTQKRNLKENDDQM